MIEASITRGLKCFWVNPGEGGDYYQKMVRVFQALKRAQEAFAYLFPDCDNHFIVKENQEWSQTGCYYDEDEREGYFTH